MTNNHMVCQIKNCHECHRCWQWTSNSSINVCLIRRNKGDCCRPDNNVKCFRIFRASYKCTKNLQVLLSLYTVVKKKHLSERKRKRKDVLLFFNLQLLRYIELIKTFNKYDSNIYKFSHKLYN